MNLQRIIGMLLPFTIVMILGGCGESAVVVSTETETVQELTVTETVQEKATETVKEVSTAAETETVQELTIEDEIEPTAAAGTLEAYSAQNDIAAVFDYDLANITGEIDRYFKGYAIKFKGNDVLFELCYNWDYGYCYNTLKNDVDWETAESNLRDYMEKLTGIRPTKVTFMYDVEDGEGTVHYNTSHNLYSTGDTSNYKGATSIKSGSVSYAETVPATVKAASQPTSITTETAQIPNDDYKNSESGVSIDDFNTNTDDASTRTLVDYDEWYNSLSDEEKAKWDNMKFE